MPPLAGTLDTSRPTTHQHGSSNVSDPFIDACVKHDRSLRGRVKLLGRLLGDVISS